MSKKVWRVVDTVFFALFLLSVFVQKNDPDPWRWMAIYALAAACCGLAIQGRQSIRLPAITGSAALVWAVTLAPGVLGRVPFLSMFGAWEMKDIGIEESREMYGLLIVAAWMAVLVARAARSNRRSAQRP